MIIDESIRSEYNIFSKVQIGDDVDPMWGCIEGTISREDIQHLLDGGCLYTSNGEYATIVALEQTHGGESE